MAQQDFGLIGLAVMGQNLVLNVNDRGYSVAVYNRTAARTQEFVAGDAAGRDIVPYYEIADFVAGLTRPRKIMLMVKAGQPVDDFLALVLPHLEPGDLLIDGGNSYFLDTIRRNRSLSAKGILFIGTGVSGGEEGARHGPSIMPGGQPEAYALVEPIFTKIAAQVDGAPCSTYIGPDGAGHYVKMVHNGIEYGDMQLISEAYFLMKEGLGMKAAQLHAVFAAWNKGELDSYLIEITRDIFARMDEKKKTKPLVELILDKAGQKGTGKWTSQSALDLGVCTPTITEAVFARCLSAIKDQRVAASKILSGPSSRYRGRDKDAFIEAIRQALYASKICSYAQGFALMEEAQKEYKWQLNFGEIAKIWRGGCIIRARFLHRITEAFTRNPQLPNLMLDPFFKDVLESSQEKWRKVVATAATLGLPAPAFSSALSYFDSYRRDRLPANLLQAQRDYFGAHTYERIDKAGVFHTEWTK